METTTSFALFMGPPLGGVLYADQLQSVLIPLRGVFTEVLHELVLVPIVIEEIVTMPVWVFEIGRSLPVSGFQHSLSQPLSLIHI